MPSSQILLRSEQSDGQLSVIDLPVSADFGGPPLHHHAFDEAFYVLEGEMTFQLGDELRATGPGEFVFAPRGSHHTLANLSGTPARPDQIRVGYAVYSTEGGLIGRVAYTDANVVVVRSPRYALRLPAKAFGVKKSGLLLPLSPKNFDNLAKLHGARTS